jgi:hypothetical protein
VDKRYGNVWINGMETVWKCVDKRYGSVWINGMETVWKCVEISLVNDFLYGKNMSKPVNDVIK